MRNIFMIASILLLSACSKIAYEHIDKAYVKDCNDRGGKVEREARVYAQVGLCLTIVEIGEGRFEVFDLAF